MAKEKYDAPTLKTIESRRRSEVGGIWRDILNIPKLPPWEYDPRALELEPAKPGLEKRPLMYPPPLHHTSYVAVDMEQVEKDPMHSDFRKRLEEKVRDESRKPRNSGQLVYSESGKYVPLERNFEYHYLPSSPCLSSATNTLVFESRFESGNLQRAVQVGFFEYDLVLRPDESGHVQWYYFMVGNVKRGVTYVFNIVNFLKPKSLYNNGLRPLLYSSTDAHKNSVGWQRAKSRCAYYSNGQKFQLTMHLTFPHDNDYCYLAHCYPYTYTDLQLYLRSLESEPSHKEYLMRSLLCSTLSQNRVDLLTITDKIDEHCIETNSKPTILLTARVHPGETQASWSMQGCIEYLISDAPQARLLRQRYVIIIVPMLNPDGVIDGQYRCCSVSGQDLNRRWLAPDEQRHPCIFHLKQLAARLNASKPGLVFYCDFHGHSTKHMAFMYGCEPTGPEATKNMRNLASEPPAAKSSDGQKNTGSNQSNGPITRYAQGPSRFPLLLSQISAAFSLPACDFRVDRSKLTTGRVVMATELGVESSYTLEVSFLGGLLAGQLVHFNQEDLRALGRHFGEALAAHHLEQKEMLVVDLGIGAAKIASPSQVTQSLAFGKVSAENVNKQAYKSAQAQRESGLAAPEGGRHQRGDSARDARDNAHLSKFLQGELCSMSSAQESANGSCFHDIQTSDLDAHLKDAENSQQSVTGGSESDCSDDDESDDDTGASAEALSDHDNELEEQHKDVDCDKQIDADSHISLTECDAPSLLLLRLAESSRSKPRRCHTDLSFPICQLSGSNHRARSLDRLSGASAVEVGQGLLVCGAALSRTIPKNAAEETGLTRSSRTTSSKASNSPQTISFSSSSCTAASSLRRLQATVSSTAQGSDMKYFASSPQRQAGQRQIQAETSGQYVAVSQSECGLASAAETCKRSVVPLHQSSGTNALGDASTIASSSDDRLCFDLQQTKTAVRSPSCSSPSLALHRVDCVQKRNLSPDMEGDCLRYAAAALGESSPNRDIHRPARTLSMDISCEMPPPLPSLQFASRTSIQSSSPSAANAAAVAALARWGVDIDSTTNRQLQRKLSPWRAGPDCNAIDSNRKIPLDDDKWSSSLKKVKEEAWLTSEGKGFPSLSNAQNNLRRILLQGNPSSSVAASGSEKVSQLAVDMSFQIPGQSSALALAACRSTVPRSAISLQRPRIVSEKNFTPLSHHVDPMPRSPGSQNENGSRRLGPSKECEESQGLEWIGGYGSKVKTSKVWKHPLLATPQISTQVSQPGLPPIPALDKNSMQSPGLKHAGKTRMSMATLTMY